MADRATPKGMSKAEYARHRRVSPAMVTKLANNGRLVMLPDGTIDAKATDVLLAKVLDPARGGKGGKSDRTKSRATATKGKRAGAPKRVPHFDSERTRREGYSAD